MRRNVAPGLAISTSTSARQQRGDRARENGSVAYRCGPADPIRGANTVPSPMHGEITTPIGDATFDAADRLAIINLIGAYVQFYDAGRLDEWQAMLADAAEVRFLNRDRTVS